MKRKVFKIEKCEDKKPLYLISIDELFIDIEFTTEDLVSLKTLVEKTLSDNKLYGSNSIRHSS